MNHEHLRWATRSENMADKELHGTSPRGERNGSAKLSDADAAALIEERKAGVHWKVLSEKYNVSKSQVYRTACGDRGGKRVRVFDAATLVND